MNFSLTQTVSKTGFLKSKDETPLFYRQFPHQEHKASVVLVHGFGEHSGRYLHLIERLLKDNFEVLSLDLRGHGYSEGKRGDVLAFHHYEDDVVAGVMHAKKSLKPGKKLLLLAHSMGALISLRVSAYTRLPIHGMVLSCPLLGLRMPMPAWKKWAAFSVASLLPKFRVSAGIKGRQLSTDEAIARSYDTDPLVLKNLSARTFWEIFKSYQGAKDLAPAVNHAFLMQVGGRDPVVDAEATQRWFGHINTKKVDATLKIYPDFLHEIYNETDRHIAIEDAMAWLNARV